MSRDRQILEAAAALFYDRGFHKVGMDDIGKRVGISGPALYRHFSGKDQIVASLFSETMEELISATAMVYTNPERDLERLVRHHVDFALDQRHLISVYQREEKSLVEPWRSHFKRRQRVYASRWEDALRRCFPTAEDAQIAAAAQAAIGMIHSVAHWPRNARRAENLGDLLFGLVRQGLAALSTESAKAAEVAASAPLKNADPARVA